MKLSAQPIFPGNSLAMRHVSGAKLAQRAAKPVAFFACINSTRWSWSKSRHLKSRMTNWNRLRLTRNAYCSCSACIIESSSFAPAIWVLRRPRATTSRSGRPGRMLTWKYRVAQTAKISKRAGCSFDSKIATGKIGSATR